MALHESIAAAIHGHNVMAAALAEIAAGRPCAAREIAAKALADLEMDPEHVLIVHEEFKPIYERLRTR